MRVRLRVLVGTVAMLTLLGLPIGSIGADGQAVSARQTFDDERFDNAMIACDGSGSVDYDVVEPTTVVLTLIDPQDDAAIDARDVLVQPGISTLSFQLTNPGGYDLIQLTVIWDNGNREVVSPIIDCSGFQPTATPPSPTPTVPPPPTATVSTTPVVTSATVDCAGTGSFDYSFPTDQTVSVDLEDVVTGEVIGQLDPFTVPAGGGTWPVAIATDNRYLQPFLTVAWGPGVTTSDSLDVVQSPPITCEVGGELGGSGPTATATATAEEVAGIPAGPVTGQPTPAATVASRTSATGATGASASAASAASSISLPNTGAGEPREPVRPGPLLAMLMAVGVIILAGHAVRMRRR